MCPRKTASEGLSKRRRSVTDELLNLSQAARALGITNKAIRKHFQRAPELNHGTPGRPKVNLKELRDWRNANVNPAKRNGDAAHLREPDAGDADLPAEITDATTFTEARRLREVIRAKNEKLAHAKAVGELVPKADGIQVVTSAARFLREEFPTRWRRLAPKLRDAKTAADIVRMLTSETDVVLKRLSDEFGR